MDFNLRSVHKWIALLMAVVMVFASVVFTPASKVSAASTLTSFDAATAISNIRYDFNIAGGAVGSSITLK